MMDSTWRCMMKPRLMDKLLEKLPISDEMKETINSQVDFSKEMVTEVVSQALLHGDRLKKELREAISKEVRSVLQEIDHEKMVAKILDKYEMDVTIRFNKRKK